MYKVCVKLYQNSNLFSTSCIPMMIPGGILRVAQLYQACYQTLLANTCLHVCIKCTSVTPLLKFLRTGLHP